MIKFLSIEYLEESYRLTFRGDDLLAVKEYLDEGIELNINLETQMVYNPNGDYIADAVKLSSIEI